MMTPKTAREFITGLRRHDFGRKLLLLADLPQEYTDEQALKAARLAADAMKRESVRRTMN